MIEFVLSTTKQQFNKIADLAAIIWREHYTPIIGKEQVEYMIENFQSTEAMYSQYKDGYQYFMVNHNKTLVGYVSIKKQADNLFLSKIYVSKDFRGQKIGKAAMAFVQQKALEMDCKNITLGVNKHNTNSIAAYKKMGFANKGSMVTDIGNGFIMDDYKMEKTLTSPSEITT